MKQRKIDLSSHSPYLSGHIETKEFRTGLSIKYEDIQVNKPAHKVSVGLFQPNLRLVITLKGISDIHFENGHFHQDACAQPKMAFLAINKQEKGRKHFASQKNTRRISGIHQPRLAERQHFFRKQRFCADHRTSPATFSQPPLISNLSCAQFSQRPQTTGYGQQPSFAAGRKYATRLAFRSLQVSDCGT